MAQQQQAQQSTIWFQNVQDNRCADDVMRGLLSDMTQMQVGVVPPNAYAVGMSQSALNQAQPVGVVRPVRRKTHPALSEHQFSGMLQDIFHDGPQRIGG